MGLFSNTKKLLGDDEPSAFKVADKIVTCSHCGSTTFQEGSAQLNTMGLTFFGLDWLDRNANILMCTNCGHIEWFVS